MKKFIHNFINSQGIDIVRKNRLNLNIYEKYPKKSITERRFYNIGAGSFKHPYWTNIDYSTEHYKKVQKNPFIHYDLMAITPLPLENDIAEIIYSSHTIEHVNDHAVRNMLKEAHRVLKKGGGIRLTTPNAWLEYQAYVNNDMSYWYWLKNYSNKSWGKIYKIPLSEVTIHQIFIHHFASQLSEISNDNTADKKYSDKEIIEIFKASPTVETLDFFTQQCKFNPDYPGSHINWWTYEKITSFLKEAGFSKIYISGAGQSLYAPMRDPYLFDSTHPKISLFIEAIK